MKFKKLPTLLSAYTFDAVKMIVTASKANNKLSMKEILRSNYNGITGVRINNQRSLKSNNYAILSVEEDGYKLVTQ
jgi:ABC-type branched-subunit amino acid transport system substrate-binding protein